MYKPVLRRRDALTAIAAIGATGAWGQVAENYPNKPIRMVVGFATGGGTDVTARLFAQKIGVQMGQTVVVENRPGASGSIAAQEVARSEPDGYKLLMIASGTLFHSAVGGKVAYNIDRDFTPISMVTIGTLILMVGSFAGGTHSPRADRVRTRQSRQANLRHRRHRRHWSPGQRDVQPHGQHQGRARAIQGQR